MSGRDDGGPAFPSNRDMRHQSNWDYEPGLSLRDYFAAKAMHAHLITDTVPGEACDALIDAAALADREPIDHLAHNAYEVADAMLKARQS